MAKAPARHKVQAGVTKAKQATTQLKDRVGGLSKTILVVSGLIVGAVVGIAATAIVKAGQSIELEIKLPNGVSANLKTSEGRVEFLDLIGRLFADEMHAAATRGVLEERGIFELSSPRLEQAIQSVKPDQKLGKSLLTMLQGGLGPFGYRFHAFRNVKSPEVVKEFDLQASEKYYDVIDVIRQYCDYGEGFCAPRPLPGVVSAITSVAATSGAVCKTSRLLGSNIVIVNEENGRRVVLYIDKHFWPCRVGDGKTKDNYILINDDDASRLFDKQVAGEWKVSIYISPPGYVPAIEVPREAIIANPMSAIENRL